MEERNEIKNQKREFYGEFKSFFEEVNFKQTEKNHPELKESDFIQRMTNMAFDDSET